MKVVDALVRGGIPRHELEKVDANNGILFDPVNSVKFKDLGDLLQFAFDWASTVQGALFWNRWVLELEGVNLTPPTPTPLKGSMEMDLFLILEALEERSEQSLMASVHPDRSGELINSDTDEVLAVFDSLEELSAWEPDEAPDVVEPGQEVILCNGWRAFIYPGEFSYLGVFRISWGIYYPLEVEETDIDWKRTRQEGLIQ